ncbi:MAG: 1-acyl-sn-glycerol-3-phosphate acyltransferase [Lysobacterales bacterium]|nr:MAG: 1-acyl-sn-glycerol-3-phosphate acyltransferase [Xanthomonadales bacterium]
MLDRLIAAVLRGLCRLVTGAQPRWLCDPRSLAPRIYFANHCSHLDTVVVWTTLPDALRDRTRPVAARDYWGHGRLRRYVADRVFDALLIDRKSTEGAEVVEQQRRETLEAMTSVLDAGRSLILYPEGTRGSGDAIQPFRAGLYHLARARPTVSLVPVYLGNLARILPKGATLPVPLQGQVVFGPELHLRAGEDKQAFLERCRHAVLELAERRA